MLSAVSVATGMILGTANLKPGSGLEGIQIRRKLSDIRRQFQFRQENAVGRTRHNAGQIGEPAGVDNGLIRTQSFVACGRVARDAPAIGCDRVLEIKDQDVG